MMFACQTFDTYKSNWSWGIVLEKRREKRIGEKKVTDARKLKNCEVRSSQPFKYVWTKSTECVKFLKTIVENSWKFSEWIDSFQVFKFFPFHSTSNNHWPLI